MKKFRRLVAFALAFMMILTSVVFSCSVSAASVKVTATDLKVTEKLSAFNVINPVEESKLSAYLTRADMVDVLVKYLRFENATPESNTTPFLDISPYDINLGKYRVLYDTGYISGDDNKNFNPDALLTYNEAITFVINAMGYKAYAVRNGGYPAGYLYTANKFNLLEGLRGNGTNPIPYCDLYRLINSSLHAYAIVSRTFMESGEAILEIQDDVTVLEELYGIKITSGIVTATENTNLLSADSSSVDKNQVKINNVLFETPEQEYAHLIGRNVVAYYKASAQKRYTVVYLEENAGYNTEYKVSAEDIVLSETSSSRIAYLDKNYKTKYLKTTGLGVPVIRNGKLHDGYGDFKNALPKEGYLIALDNTGDSVIDVIFVYEYENYYVGTINKNTRKYYDKIDSREVILDHDVDDVRVYDATGKQTKTSSIKSGDLITVMKSENANGYKLITVYINNKTVEGKVTAIEDGKYRIGDSLYETAKNLRNYKNISPVSLGTSAVFYLDYFGEIAYYENQAVTDATYGFVAGVASSNIANTLENRIVLKIYTQDAAWVEAELADRVKIDGKNYRITDKNDFLTITDTTNPLIRDNEVVLFKVTNGKINFIDTGKLNDGNTTKLQDRGNLTIIAERKAQTPGETINLGWRGNIAYENGVGTFVAKSNEVIVFDVPEQSRLLDDLNKYNVTKSIDVNGKKGEYIAYNLGEQEIDAATCILIKGGGIAGDVLKMTDSLAVVLRDTVAIDEDGDTRNKLYYSINGAENDGLIGDVFGYRKYWHNAQGNNFLASQKPDQTKTFDQLQLKPGDIIQVGKDDEGYIVDINVIYRADRKANPLTGYDPEDAYFKNSSFSHLVPSIASGTSGNILGKDHPHAMIMAQFDYYDPTSGFIKFYVRDVDSSGNEVERREYIISVSSASISSYDSVKEKCEAINAENLVRDNWIFIKSSAGYSATASQVIMYN